MFAAEASRFGSVRLLKAATKSNKQTGIGGLESAVVAWVIASLCLLIFIAMDEMVNDLLPLAAKIAWDFDNIPGLPHAEIEMAAQEALARAARLFDPTKGDFPAYASRAMRNALRDGKSYSEIGASLGVSKQAAHKLAHAAIAALRERLESMGFSGVDTLGFLKSSCGVPPQAVLEASRRQSSTQVDDFPPQP